MLLTLYDSHGKVKARLEPDDSSTQDKEIQGDNLLKLSFTLYEFVPFDVNDYVDYCGERYRALERYVPSEKSSVEWDYNVLLYGVESLIKRFLVLNLTDGDGEAVFSLTARPAEHVRLIVANINAGMGGMADFKVGAVEGMDNVTIDYSGKYCDDGLKELAEAVGAEWWIDGETVNLCRCEHGEEISLGYDKGLTALDRDTADGAKFYTRLFPIGSTRNIDPEKYGHSRLMLPGGAKYVDVNVDKYGIIHHYEQGAFADIYPRRVGVVGSVRQSQVNDKDGKPFTIYYFRDNDLPFDPNDYEIGGLVKRVSFQEGSELAGLGTGNDHYFEVNFNSDTREFELITIWPYDDDTQLPGGTLVPKAGDKYILWNIRMPEEYYVLAEKELLSAVYDYNSKHALDVSRYKAPTDHVWMEESGAELSVGRRVRLESREYFPDTGYRRSRITRISRRVNLPGQMDLEIGDALSRGAMTRVDDSLADVREYVRNGLASLPDLIRTGDDTRATDNNLFSALRSLKEFLSKSRDDAASGVLTFLKGVLFGKDGKGIDGDGRAELLSVVSEVLRSYDFDSLTESGFGVERRDDGKYRLSVTDLVVWGKAVFRELEIRRLSYVGGNMVFSACGSRITSVEDMAYAYRCRFCSDDGTTATTNLWKAGDQARCQTFNIREGSYDGVSNRSYWRLVTAVGDDYVDLSKADCEEGSDTPRAGDALVQMGSRADTDRMSMIYVVVTGEDAPAIISYDGVNSYTLDGKMVSVVSPRRVVFSTRNYRLMTNSGEVLPVVTDRGEWVRGKSYWYFDRVSHGGRIWLCAASDGRTVTSEPSPGNPDWLLQVDKGDDGESPVLLRIEGGNIIRNGQGSITLTAVAERGNEDISDSFPPSAYSWERDSGNAEYDAEWNNRHRGAGRVITVGAQDIFGKANFDCILYM